MGVTVNKTGQNGAVRKIYQCSVGGNGQAFPDRFDLVVADDDDLISEHRGVVGIDQAAGFDGGDLGGGGQGSEKDNASQFSFHFHQNNDARLALDQIACDDCAW